MGTPGKDDVDPTLGGLNDRVTVLEKFVADEVRERQERATQDAATRKVILKYVRIGVLSVGGILATTVVNWLTFIAVHYTSIGGPSR